MAELADVMELGCLPQLGLVLARQAHPLPEGFGEAGHGGVALGELWVAFLEGAEQYVAALTVRGAPLAGFLGADGAGPTRRMASVTSWLSWGSRMAP